MSEKRRYVVDENRLAVQVPSVLTWINLDGVQVLFVPTIFVETEDKQLLLYGVPRVGFYYE